MIYPAPPVIDDDLLSAYLDGQLAPAERNRLEAALAHNPQQRAALAQLRYTRTLLAEAPRLAVPRAFTLNEAMLASQPRRGWASWFQPAAARGFAALAGLLLLVVLIGDIGTRTQWLGEQTTATRTELGGLAADQGDPTAIIAKTSPATTALSAPTWLGLPAGVLLAVEIVLAVLAVGLLFLARQMSRGP
ncbi:MAG: zf-HC2 domain-containing protein [Caldilineales bacterium]